MMFFFGFRFTFLQALKKQNKKPVNFRQTVVLLFFCLFVLFVCLFVWFLGQVQCEYVIYDYNNIVFVLIGLQCGWMPLENTCFPLKTLTA